MKKLLVASTALVAFATVSSAQAADPISISVGGFMEQYVGYADSDDQNTTATTQYAKIQEHSDVEIYFRGSTTLDNGLSVGVVVDMEADHDGGMGEDDVYLQVSSANMGTLRLGATKGFGAANYVMSPDVGIGQGDVDNWITMGTAITATDRDNSGDDGQKITYSSPSFGGLTVGASYGVMNGVANSDDTMANLIGTAVETEMTVGASYSGEFSGAAVSAAIGYIRQSDEENTTATVEDHKELHAGLSVSMAGFTVGGGVTDINNRNTVKDRDGFVWDAGVSYETGPYAVSLAYTSSEIEASATDSREDKYETFIVSGAYDLGAGVTAVASVFTADDEDSNAATTQGENDGFGVVAGLKVSF